jgi:hypothetical protein
MYVCNAQLNPNSARIGTQSLRDRCCHDHRPSTARLFQARFVRARFGPILFFSRRVGGAAIAARLRPDLAAISPKLSCDRGPVGPQSAASAQFRQFGLYASGSGVQRRSKQLHRRQSAGNADLADAMHVQLAGKSQSI